jgi:hypothetical protein
MTPGPARIPIYKGARFEFDVELLQDTEQPEEQEQPADLSGLGPFKLAVELPDGTTVLGEVQSAYDVTGLIKLIIGADVTDTFPIGEELRWSVYDDNLNAYIDGISPVKFFARSRP